ncbi:type II toxin-antitoxin system VapC family toxin [Candidatus Shapirobacteria bacterium]|nr:type II toxin-antitoxin system VapC family toxin [Candidatus Shapirobacteria bacterium]
MRKIFIDTNVWLRFLLADKKDQFEACQKLLDLNEQGKLRSYTSTIVFLEIAYTLASFYKIERKQIIADLEDVLLARNLTLIEKTDFANAFSLFQQYQIKMADCLIATQLPKGAALCTYDQDFKKIRGLAALTPEEILKQFP